MALRRNRAAHAAWRAAAEVNSRRGTLSNVEFGA